MAQGARARACSRDLAGIVAKKTKRALQLVVILIHCSRAQCGRVHIVPVDPAFPIAVAMVACKEECAVMGSHRDQDCSWILEEQVEYIVAVMWATAVADAAEVCIHSGLRAGRVVSSVGDKDRRDLGCCSAVPAVAAD